jgi:hypothetical protein
MDAPLFLFLASLAAYLLRRTEEDVKRRWEFFKHAAARSFRPTGETPL